MASAGIEPGNRPRARGTPCTVPPETSTCKSGPHVNVSGERVVRRQAHTGNAHDIVLDDRLLTRN